MIPRLRLLACLAFIPSVLCAQTATTLNVSSDLVRLGVAGANMVPNQPALDSGPLFEAAVRYAVQNRFTRVTAEPGAYYFLSASAGTSSAHVAFPAPAAANPALTIDLQGADLYMGIQGKIGIFVTGGANLTLQNFTVDYVQQNYTQVLVTSVDFASRTVQFSVQPGWQNPTALNALLPGETYAYFFRNGQPWIGFTRMNAVSPFNDTSVTMTSAIAPGTVAGIRTGDVGVIQVRTGGNALLAVGLSNSTFRNIRVYNGGSGVRLLRTSGMLLEHVEVMPRPGTDRLISTVADGIQPQQLGPNNTIRLCRAIRTCDDGFSPVTFVFGSVQSVAGPRTVQIAGDANTALNGNSPLPNGSNIAFERAADGAIVATATVVSQTTAAAINGIPQVVLTLDRDVPTGVSGTYVYGTDASWRGGGLVLERNAVEYGGWARGISVWGQMDATLRGNYIYHAAFAGIDLQHQLFTGDWLVPPAVNVTLANNVIDGTILAPDLHTRIQLAGINVVAEPNPNSVGPMTSSPHQNLTLKDNFIGDPGRSAVWMGNTAGGTINGNYLFNPNNNPNATLGDSRYRVQASTQALVLDASQNISVDGNTIDGASKRVFVTEPGFRELAAYAPGSSIRLSAYNLGNLAAPTLSLTDADGHTWSLTAAATSTHAIDVALPAGIALGGAVISVKAQNASYFGTLFIDDQDNLPVLNQASYLVSTSTNRVPAAGGPVDILVVTPSGASYTLAGSPTGTPAGIPRTGTAVTSIPISANTGGVRVINVDVAGQLIPFAQSAAADPVFVTQPLSQSVQTGGTATFTASATGAQSYQWALNGVAVPFATAATLTINPVNASAVGTYTVVARNASGFVTSNGALLTLNLANEAGRLGNLSILTNLAAGQNFTVGTFIGGAGTAGTKPLLIRAAGPALAALGVGGAHSDPKMDVFSGQTVVASNDNWGGSAALGAAFSAVGAFAYPSPDSKDAAVYNPGLGGGGYTVQISGVGNAAGTVIAELYDATPANQFQATTPRLVNVSVLKQINAGETLIAGFVITGSTSKQVLIRAGGPALTALGVGGTMADPKLELYNGQAVVASNDDWGTPVGAGAATAAQLTAAFAGVGAFAFPPGSRDAALLVTLPPGNYTAQVTGVGSAGGQAIVEVYEVQ